MSITSDASLDIAGSHFLSATTTARQKHKSTDSADHRHTLTLQATRKQQSSTFRFFPTCHVPPQMPDDRPVRLPLGLQTLNLALEFHQFAILAFCHRP